MSGLCSASWAEGVEGVDYGTQVYRLQGTVGMDPHNNDDSE